MPAIINVPATSEVGLVTFSPVLFSLISLLISEGITGLIWLGSVSLVTRAGFLADQLMRDKKQQTTTAGSSNDRCSSWRW